MNVVIWPTHKINYLHLITFHLTLSSVAGKKIALMCFNVHLDLDFTSPVVKHDHIVNFTTFTFCFEELRSRCCILTGAFMHHGMWMMKFKLNRKAERKGELFRQRKGLYLFVHLSLWTALPRTIFSASAQLADYVPMSAASLPRSAPAA